MAIRKVKVRNTVRGHGPVGPTEVVNPIEVKGAVRAKAPPPSIVRFCLNCMTKTDKAICPQCGNSMIAKLKKKEEKRNDSVNLPSTSF